MARARNIKPAFFKNEALAECSPLARLLFAGLWCLADREGRLEDRPKRIRAEIFPYDDCSVESLLQELDQAGFIKRYNIASDGYIQVVNFRKHQNPHHREVGSTIPAPGLPEASPRNVSEMPEVSTRLASDKPESSPADSLNLIPDSLIQNLDANASVATGKPDADQLPCPFEEIIEAYHESMPLNPRCKVLNDPRKRAIRKRWREAARMSNQPFGYATRSDGLRAWRQFFEVCAESDFLTGKVPGRNGAPPFVADVDFLFSPNGFAKVLENKYHREAA